jgi:effector-binding domain-containing protein
MKILRRILTFILCLALILIAAGFLLPRKVYVERSLFITAPQKSIFQQVNVLKNWAKWSPWLLQDTLTQLQFSGPESGTGAMYSWKSSDRNVGSGSLSIVASYPSDSLLLVMDFGRNGKSTSKFILVSEGQSTTVKWSLESDLGMNPVSRWFGLISDRMIGPDLERGLFNLEQRVDDLKRVNGFEIIEFEVPARILLSVRDTVKSDNVTEELAIMYNKISGYLKSRNLSPTGAPIAIFHSYTKESLDIEACMPVASLTVVSGDLICKEQPVQKTIMVKYFGSYNLIARAYSAMHTYLDNSSLKLSGPAWEEYISDPSVEIDSNKWQTNIYYPL